MALIYDFHAHVYAEKIAEKLIGKMEDIYGIKRYHNALIDELLPAAENGGVDKVCILSIAGRPEHVVFNKWYAELGEKYEAVIPFGSIHVENSPEELDCFPELGLRGIKIQPNAQRFYPDDERMFPIYRRAEELGLIVVFHAGHEEGGVAGEFSQPERFVKVIESCPNLKVVLAHFGGYKVWDKVDAVCGYPNVYFDTAHLPGVIDDRYFVEMAEKLGVDKVLFGTDFPFRDHKTEREYVERIFGSALARKFMSENPERVLGV
jgi:predicted TIM-barrel fold metal-dependent hydrolase